MAGSPVGRGEGRETRSCQPPPAQLPAAADGPGGPARLPHRSQALPAGTADICCILHVSILSLNVSLNTSFLCPRHSKNGGGALSVTPVRACVRPSVQNLVSAQLRIEFHSGCIYWIMNAMVKMANP